MTEQQLPQLPPKAGWAPALDNQDIYTADQMRAYAIAAVAAERERVAALPSGRDGEAKLRVLNALEVLERMDYRPGDRALVENFLRIMGERGMWVIESPLPAAPAMGAPEEGEPRVKMPIADPTGRLTGWPTDADGYVPPAAPSQGTLTDEEIQRIAGRDELTGDAILDFARAILTAQGEKK